MWSKPPKKHVPRAAVPTTRGAPSAWPCRTDRPTASSGDPSGTAHRSPGEAPKTRTRAAAPNPGSRPPWPEHVHTRATAPRLMSDCLWPETVDAERRVGAPVRLAFVRPRMPPPLLLAAATNRRQGARPTAGRRRVRGGGARVEGGRRRDEPPADTRRGASACRRPDPGIAGSGLHRRVTADRTSGIGAGRGPSPQSRAPAVATEASTGTTTPPFLPAAAHCRPLRPPTRSAS